MKEYFEVNTDFRTLFVIGIIFTGAGVAMGFYPVMIFGLLFMVIGLLNRDAWPQNEKFDEN